MRIFGRPSTTAEHSALTDLGRRRDKNEDAFDVIVAPSGGGWGFELALVVCDGVGGHPQGEVASRLAASAVRAGLAKRDDRPMRARLIAASEAANAAVIDFAAREAGGAALATTLAMLVLGGDTATIGHVGDSRVYRYRAGRLEVLTRDHSFVAEQVHAGLISPEAARTHPLRSRLSRAIGVGPATPDLSESPATSGDLYLVCSDGLHAFVDESDVAKALVGDLSEIARRLVDLANAAGGVDNVTVALARVP